MATQRQARLRHRQGKRLHAEQTAVSIPARADCRGAVPAWQAPVLPSTLLCLQLLLTQPCLDLRAVTHLLRRDPGAVLRLYALVAAEFPKGSDRPERLEDCIASVGVPELSHALQTSDSMVKNQMQKDQPQLMSFAQHALVIAAYAEMVAASLALCEHRAYLVGLFHAIGSLPAYRKPGTKNDKALDTISMARHWTQSHSLPPMLCHAIDEVHRELPGSVWMAMVRAAHDLARHAGQIR